MKATPEISSTLLADSDEHEISSTIVDPADRCRPSIPSQTATAAPRKKFPELTTFRSLSRQVFGAEANREYIQEAILFGWIMLVAAWPLSVTLDQLGTMMISPPNALW